MLGIVDVGGGLRGAYGAGIMDRCLDEKIHFDDCIGVSAGAANVCSYMAGQKGRNYLFYTDYIQRPQYMSVGNLLKTGSYLDMDYIYGTLSVRGGENPLDYPALAANPARLCVVATRAADGKPLYLTKQDMAQDDYAALKGSCCLPIACKPYPVHGVPCYDGGVSDPVPLDKALADGCDRVVLVLTRPLSTDKKPGKDAWGAALLRRKYPQASAELSRRAERYNQTVARALKMQKQGRVLVLAPDDTCGMGTLTKDKAKIDALYRKGYSDAAKIKDFLAQTV